MTLQSTWYCIIKTTWRLVIPILNVKTRKMTHKKPVQIQNNILLLNVHGIILIFKLLPLVDDTHSASFQTTLACCNQNVPKKSVWKLARMKHGFGMSVVYPRCLDDINTLGLRVEWKECLYHKLICIYTNHRN